MIHKELGFELQRVTRQSLPSLKQFDRHYLDFVIANIFEKISQQKKSLLVIDDLDLKEYVSWALRQYFVVQKAKAHILILNSKTSALPFDVPFDNRILIVDIHPDTPELFVGALDRLVASCAAKNVPLLFLTCKSYALNYLQSFERLDQYDCVLSEHEFRQISSMMNLMPRGDLYRHTSGMPHLFRTWIEANEEDVSFRHSEQYEKALTSALAWYTRDDLHHDKLSARLQMLLVGEGTYDELSHMEGFNLSAVASPFTVSNGRGISCAGFDDHLTYRRFFNRITEKIYEMEGALVHTLEFLFAHKKYKQLSRALTILPMNDVIAQYVARVPFDVINCGHCDLIDRAMSFDHALSTSELLCLKMGEAAISGNREMLEAHLTSYKQLDFLDSLIIEQAEAIVRSYALLQGERYSSNSSIHTSNPFLSKMNLHCEVIEHVMDGHLEAAYQLVLLQQINEENTFIDQILQLDLVMLSMLLGDDTWNVFDDEYRMLIEGLSASGLLSVNLFIPVFNDCIEGTFNQNMNAFSLERAISTAQCRGYNFLASCLLAFSVAYNLHIRNSLKAYTQVKLLHQTASVCDSQYLKGVSEVLLLLARKHLNEPVDLPEDAIDNYPDTAEGDVLKIIIQAIIGQKISGDAIHPETPSGVWWLLYLIEDVDIDLFSDVVREMHPVWTHDYNHYKLRIVNLTQGIREALKMSKAEEQLLKERNMLYIKVMGSIDIRSSGREIREEDWSRKAAKMLLLYLAVAENHTLSRADLQELIWPDKDYIAARGNLYTALSSLKRTIGHNDELRPFIKCFEGHIALNPECVRVDSDTFLRVSRKMLDPASDPNAVLTMYEDLVSCFDGGLFAPIGDESGLFHARQEYFKSLFLETLMTLAEISLKMRRPRQAVRCAREILSVDDCREDAFILFIQALHSMGRRAEVVTAYNIFSKNLITKYGIAVSSSTRDIYAGIIQDDSYPESAWGVI